MDGLVELKRQLNNIVRVGVIADVDHDSALARLQDDDLLTNWRPWIELRAGTTRTWNPPTVGEQAVLFCAGGDPADSFILTGLFSTAAPAPSNDANVTRTDYPDGAAINYDHKEHHLTVSLPGGATASFDKPISITSPQTTHNGPLHVTGGIICDADVVASGISLTKHTHGGVKSGGSNTSGPN